MATECLDESAMEHMEHMKQLKRVRKLIDQRLYQEAMCVCDEILLNHPRERAEVLRQRAHICRYLRRYADGVESCEEIFQLDEGDAGDYFCAADLSLYDEQFEKAIAYIEKSIEIETAMQRAWFMSTSLAYLLYALIKTGELERAEDVYTRLKALERDAGDGIPIPNAGWITLGQFREKIDKDRARNERPRQSFRFE
jgi:tetratricopeptide (TPR) repeat protein